MCTVWTLLLQELYSEKNQLHRMQFKGKIDYIFMHFQIQMLMNNQLVDDIVTKFLYNKELIENFKDDKIWKNKRASATEVAS